MSAAGFAYIVPFEAESAAQQKTFMARFDRSSQYAELITRLGTLKRSLAKSRESLARQGIAAVRREVAAIESKDLFPGESRRRMHAALADLEAAFNTRFVPGEPRASRKTIQVLDRKQYEGRTWATRERLWIDRVASAWLIRRFLDPTAKFLWLKDIKKRPRQVVGFDFDGAEFTHIGTKVTFEVLMASFALEQDAALRRLAALVHYLDVGGIPVAEAPGFTAVITGARLRSKGDNALLEIMSLVLDSLYATWSLSGANSDEKSRPLDRRSPARRRTADSCRSRTAMRLSRAAS